MISYVFSSNLTRSQTQMERLTPELFKEISPEIQKYHLEKALVKLRRRQVTLMHALVSRYYEVVQQDGLTDIFHMNTCIRTFTYGILEHVENIHHPNLQQQVNPIKMQELLLDCIDCIEKLSKYSNTSIFAMPMFHFIQQFGKFQKDLKEKFSITWIPISI